MEEEEGRYDALRGSIHIGWRRQQQEIYCVLGGADM